MAANLLTYFYFSVAVLAVIVFIDVLVKFKNGLDLKFFFLLLPFAAFFVGLINSIESQDYVYHVAFFKSCMGVSLLNIFSILYFPRFKRWTLLFSILLVSITFLFMLLNNNYIQPVGVLNYFKVDAVDEHLNIQINPVLRLIRLSLVLAVGLHLIYFWYVIYKRLNLNNLYFEKIKNWSTGLLILTFCVLGGNITIAFVQDSDRLFWANILSLFIGYYLLLMILKRPSFLNTSAKKIAFGHKFNLEQEAEIEELVFLQIFQEQKYYAKNDATLEGLASQLKVSSQHLSLFITKKYAMSFSDLVNKNRVNYFFEIVQDPAYQNYTIDALAREVGFSSRQHLNKPFKKFHGGNPSDLIESAISID